MTSENSAETSPRLKESDALAALKNTFRDRYVLFHPRLEGCIPDAMTLKMGGFFELSGFEVKSSRTNWLSELRLKKNARAHRVCDYWSIIAPSDAVYPTDLRDGWGLYRVVTDRLVCEVSPKLLTSPGPVDRELVSRLLSAVVQDIPETDTILKVRDAAYTEAFRLLFENSAMMEMGVEKMKKFIKLLEDRAQVRAVFGLHGIRNQVVGLLAKLDQYIPTVKVESDWETGGEFSPAALRYGEDCKNQLLNDRSTSVYFKNNHDALEKIVRNKMASFMGE